MTNNNTATALSLVHQEIAQYESCARVDQRWQHPRRVACLMRPVTQGMVVRGLYDELLSHWIQGTFSPMQLCLVPYRVLKDSPANMLDLVSKFVLGSSETPLGNSNVNGTKGSDTHDNDTHSSDSSHSFWSKRDVKGLVTSEGTEEEQADMYAAVQHAFALLHHCTTALLPHYYCALLLFICLLERL